MKQKFFYIRNQPWRAATDALCIDEKPSWYWQSPEWWIKCDGYKSLVEKKITLRVYRSMWPNVGLSICRYLHQVDPPRIARVEPYYE